MRMAPGEATGLGATHPASDEKLSEDRLLGEAPGGTSSTHLLWLVLYWERLHRFELLPCWSDARRRPPASLGGYRCSGAWSPSLGWGAVPITGSQILRPTSILLISEQLVPYNKNTSHCPDFLSRVQV